MADNVKVRPSTAESAVSVATVLTGSTHYPVYLPAIEKDDGSVELVGSENQLQVEQFDIVPMLEAIETQVKITNMHLSLLTGADFTEKDVD